MTIHDDYDTKLKTTVFFIEANSYEQLALWREYKDMVDWEQDQSGFMETIGYIDDDKNRPVCVSFTFAFILGQRICFYYATSRFVNQTMIENYIKTNYPITHDNGHRISMTDAMNFSHCFSVCEKLSGKERKERPKLYNKDEILSILKKFNASTSISLFQTYIEKWWRENVK